MQLVTIDSDYRPIRLIDWRPKPNIQPNEQLLQILKRTKSRQNTISKERQNFLIGTSNYMLTAKEKKLRADYIQEWHIRIRENVPC